jgi:hypothetical protein
MLRIGAQNSEEEDRGSIKNELLLTHAHRLVRLCS